jgi:hypothetical protein
LIHAQCRNCGTFDLLGPGHPAGETDPVTGQFTWTDRSALRHSHADDCQPGDDGNYPLDITLFGATGAS